MRDTGNQISERWERAATNAFNFPAEVRRKSCRKEEEGRMFGLWETISGQLILWYNHTLSSHMNSFTSERSHTHISVQCEWSMCLLPLQGQIKQEQEASVPPWRHPHVMQNQVKGQIVVSGRVTGLPMWEGAKLHLGRTCGVSWTLRWLILA